MLDTVSIEIPLAQEEIVREELDQLALAAPDGTVFAACESAVIAGGRDLQLRMLHQAVTRRIETAEKRWRRFDSVRAAADLRLGSERTGIGSPDFKNCKS